MSVTRMAVLAALLGGCPSGLGAQVRIAGTAPAPARQPARTSWTSQLAGAAAEASAPPPVPRNLATCAASVLFPDSLALVGGAGDAYSLDIWRGSRAGWAIFVDPPTGPDTLRTRVIGADCGVMPLRILVAAAGTYLAVNPRTASPDGIDIITQSGKATRAHIEMEVGGSEIRVVPMDPSVLRGLDPQVAQAKRDAMIARIPASYRAMVLEGTVRVGMPARYARLSWGEPESINTTSTLAGTSEQWVYGVGTYLYVEGGVVTGVQTTDH